VVMLFVVPVYEARYPYAPSLKVKGTCWVVWSVFKRMEEALRKALSSLKLDLLSERITCKRSSVLLSVELS